MENLQKTAYTKLTEPSFFLCSGTLHKKIRANYAAIIRYDDFELFCV